MHCAYHIRKRDVETLLNNLPQKTLFNHSIKLQLGYSFRIYTKIEAMTNKFEPQFLIPK
jgi:hypothetical protein